MRVAGESLTLSSARREYGLVAGDQSAARLARVIIGHVGGDVHTETVARELVVHSMKLSTVVIVIERDLFKMVIWVGSAIRNRLLPHTQLI